MRTGSTKSWLLCLVVVAGCKGRNQAERSKPASEPEPPAAAAATIEQVLVGTCGVEVPMAALAGREEDTTNSRFIVPSRTAAVEVVRAGTPEEEMFRNSNRCGLDSEPASSQPGCVGLVSAPKAACAGSPYKLVGGGEPAEAADDDFSGEEELRFFVAVSSDLVPPTMRNVEVELARHNLRCDVESDSGRTRATLTYSDKTSTTSRAIEKQAKVAGAPYRILSARIDGFAPRLHFVHGTHQDKKTLVFAAYLERGDSLVEVTRSELPVDKARSHLMKHQCGLPHGLPYPAAVFSLAGDDTLYLATASDPNDALQFSIWTLTEASLEKRLDLPGSIPNGKF